MIRISKIALICLLPLVVRSYHNIVDYGAITDQSDTNTSFINANAFTNAVLAANASLDDKEVYIPEGGVFTMMPSHFSNLTNITITIDGTVVLSSDYENWPNETNRCYNFWTIYDSKYIFIRGSGVVDGQGYWWWMREYVGKNIARRPDLLYMRRVQYAQIEGVKWMNSPQFHMYLVDIDSFLIQNFEIYVDVVEQKKLAQKHGFFDYQLSIPTFPLNTDGIDPSGTNIIIRNVSITNFDDAVAVKPANQDYQVAKCAANILVENCHVTFGVGMTLGTVVPHDTHNCIANVTFRNIVFKSPFKAIYIKTNPGNEGDGIIENILYENIKIYAPIWWAIYIGPQQQKQPDGRGPGCMFYPLIKDCETQPRVTIRNLTLRNITSENGVMTPGIIRCNETNPCRDFTFENVQMKGWFNQVNLGFITENVIGTVINSKPSPHFQTEEEWNTTSGKMVLGEQYERLFDVKEQALMISN